MGTYFGDTSDIGDWRSRRLLVRSQIARGALTALPPSQRKFGIARLRESGRRAGAAVAHRRPCELKLSRKSLRLDIAILLMYLVKHPNNSVELYEGILYGVFNVGN